MLRLKDPMASFRRSGCLRPATLWTITRADGVVLRFTDHDAPLSVDGQTFAPAAADASARQKRAGLDGQNREFRGAISSDQITFEDLAAGRYRGATVLEQTVDWLYPWQGEFERAEYDITSTTQSGEDWAAEVDGKSARLSRNIGAVYTRDCRAVLGDSKCAKNLTAFTYTGKTVTAIVRDRVEFDTDLSTSLASAWFAHGKVTWLTGANAGTVSDVQQSTSANGRLRLEIATPFAIAVGDTFTAVAGCDGNFTTCRSKYSNAVNFQGYPDQPGPNAVLKAPRPK